DHENIGRCVGDRIGGLPNAPQDRRQPFRDRGKADDRQFLDWKHRRQPLLHHRPAADAIEPHRAAKALAQHLHQAGAEPISGFLGRDKEDVSRDVTRCPRRRHAGTPVTKRPLASAASITASGSAIIVWPATIAIPASWAEAAPSTVRGPTVGRSNRRSCPLLGALTSTPRAVAARIRPSARSRATRASSPSVPSISSTPTTWPSTTTAAWPMSKRPSASSTSRP